MSFSFGADPPNDPPFPKIPPDYPTDFDEFESTMYEQAKKLEQTEIAFTLAKKELKVVKLKNKELTEQNEILNQTLMHYTKPTPYNSLKVS